MPLYSCVERFPEKFYFCSCQIGKPRNLRAYVFPRYCVPVTKSCLGAQSKQKYMFCLVGSVFKHL